MLKRSKLAPLAVTAGALALNGCAGANRNSPLEYREGVVTLAVDPASSAVAKPREITRNKVLAMLGVSGEGRQSDNSYVLCADMSPVFASDDMGQEDLDRIAFRFEPVLMEQASSFIVAENCANYFTARNSLNCGQTADMFLGSGNCMAGVAENTGTKEGVVKGLTVAHSRHAGNYVCLWTTRPEEVICK